MEFWNLAIRIIFLSQTTTGILGNLSVLYSYLVRYGECKLKPTDLILMHLMTANTIIILSTGVAHTMATFALKQFLNDFGCRLILYIQRIGRSVSIGTTCLLSVFQAMNISNKKSCCKDQKVKASKYIGCSIAILWVLYMLINTIFFVYPIIKSNIKNVTRERDFGYCSTDEQDEIKDSIYVVLVVCPEVFFSVLIAYSSGFMIVILYKHKQKVQYIRSTHDSNRNSPESRATKKILILISTFLAFYTLSSILQGCIALLHNHNWWLVNITCLTSLCFPCFGPFILINHHFMVPRLSLIWIRNKN
ncbi:vomeronasal type-1 receptor 4-like [Peromyscus californicus insignis]|uniref:vomeronasal type-1 receptor 4-like n=1 Tax=Peromyscus californicus insignis TaxID=564181 RepID=UPI0022A7193A|nr:vomeronasal type-1 receptor 4-like [Peromyscus californicus insignis]